MTVAAAGALSAVAERPAGDRSRVFRPCAFRPDYRLRKTDEFSSVFALKRALRSTHFVLNFAPSASGGSRLGLVVAKRFLKRAVARNLVKRIAREAFRQTRSSLPAMDLVLRLNARPQPLDRRVLRLEIDSLYTRLAERAS